MSNAQKGDRNHRFGKKTSPEHSRKLSEAKMGEKNHNFGRVFSEEHRRRISESTKGKPQKSKQVLQIDRFSNETIKEWRSVREANEFFKSSENKTGNIFKAIQTSRTSLGFKWKFKPDG